MALEFVAQNTSIPVPKVLAIFVVKGSTHIVMEYIDAPELEKVWKTLSHHDRLSIMKQIQAYLKQLRALFPPKDAKISAISGRKLYDPRTNTNSFGPFDSIDEFNRFIGLEYIRENDQVQLDHPDFRVHFDRCAGRSYKVCFTHGDIARRNILVKDAKVVGIVDWEFASWYRNTPAATGAT